MLTKLNDFLYIDVATENISVFFFLSCGGKGLGIMNVHLIDKCNVGLLDSF